MDFADPDYIIPTRVDILLRGKVFRKAVLHGWQFGPTGAHSAFKTCFGWVLNGKVKGEGRQSLTHICCVAFANNALTQFCEIDDHNQQKLILSPEEMAVIKQFKRFHVRDKEERFTSHF